MGFNMKDLQQMQAKMMKMQEDLQNSTFEGTSGGDAVHDHDDWQVRCHCHQAEPGSG